MVLAPIVLFVYNRPWHTKQTIEALQKNELAIDSHLYIYSDGAKDEASKDSVDEVREYIDSVDGFRSITIIKQEKNRGLANSIIDGVTKIVNKYGHIIVLEDDLVTSPYFLKFMNKNLTLYRDDKRVASIHGYIYPIDNLPDIFFIKGADCWGWATWDRAWSIFERDGDILLKELQDRRLKKEIDFNGSYPYVQMLRDQIDGKNNSWAIRWYISTFLEDMLTLYPSRSYIENIGIGGESTHCSTKTNIYDVEINHQLSDHKIDIKEDLEARDKIVKFFKSTKKSLLKRVISKLKRVIS